MWWKSLSILISFVVFTISDGFALVVCPSADLNGDCFVNFEDFALMAGQWLTAGPNILDDMAYIPSGEFDMGDHHNEGDSDELPVHAVLLDSFFMSKSEINNQQYCNYLNSAYPAQIKVVSGVVYASSDSGNSYPYCDMHSYAIYGQIDYSGGVFSVRTKGGRDMSNDPMVEVSWYGAADYCNWRSSEESREILLQPFHVGV
jgi:formylglycine-generating enzyme required for sulfatase activity